MKAAGTSLTPFTNTVEAMPFSELKQSEHASGARAQTLGQAASFASGFSTAVANNTDGRAGAMHASEQLKLPCACRYLTHVNAISAQVLDDEELDRFVNCVMEGTAHDLKIPMTMDQVCEWVTDATEALVKPLGYTNSNYLDVLVDIALDKPDLLEHSDFKQLKAESRPDTQNNMQRTNFSSGFCLEHCTYIQSFLRREYNLPSAVVIERLLDSGDYTHASVLVQATDGAVLIESLNAAPFLKLPNNQLVATSDGQRYLYVNDAPEPVILRYGGGVSGGTRLTFWSLRNVPDQEIKLLKPMSNPVIFVGYDDNRQVTAVIKMDVEKQKVVLQYGKGRDAERLELEFQAFAYSGDRIEVIDQSDHAQSCFLENESGQYFVKDAFLQDLQVDKSVLISRLQKFTEHTDTLTQLVGDYFKLA